jgi:hypothetical protein
MAVVDLIAAARLPSSSPRASHSRWIVASISEKSPDGALLLLPKEAADFSQSPGWGTAITAVSPSYSQELGFRLADVA